ncbi:MAG: type II toxin-antitoxin system HicA family toxin [Candidatus Eremiobacteraeota bacterium]|nr:type II toxin-antitoxin system HicA family toxin [Candidatus Eremiobacteraeota bacterium]
MHLALRRVGFAAFVRCATVTAKELARLAESNGWYFARQCGSHRIYKHKHKPYDITIPDHGSREVRRGLCKTILKQIAGTWKKRQ